MKTVLAHIEGMSKCVSANKDITECYSVLVGIKELRRPI